MKKRYLTLLILWGALAACTSNQATSTYKPAANLEVPAQVRPPRQNVDQSNIDEVLNRIKVCVNALNTGPSANLVDGQILALNQDNPNAIALFSSNEKLTDEQVSALAIFKRDAQKCRQITNQITNLKLRKTYQNLFAKLDRVYEDLIYRRINIGVANQERVLLVDDFRMQWRDETKKQHGR